MTLVLNLALGVLIGLSLGALGGGGSILTVPALVYVLSEPAQAATTESLVIVGLTSLVAAIGHARARNVRWSAGIVFGLTGVVASYAGTALNRHIDPNLLLLAFAGLIVVAAVAMLRRVRRPVTQRASVLASVGGVARGDATGDAVGPVGAGIRRGAITPAVVPKMVTAGLVVGFLTGFFGVGGGFVIVPALVMALGFDMPVAVGTSLLVIAINSAAALAARSASEAFHWSVIVPFTVAATMGSLAGKRVADQVSSGTLTKAFVTLLFAVAVYVAIRSGAALTR
jgi:uncharacterized membrane protein YfcA